MKLQFNLTDSYCDMERFQTRADLEDLLTGFDGIELMHYEEDVRGLITPEMVVGYHMSFPQYWVDFWNGELDRCRAEYDTLENAFCYYTHGDLSYYESFLQESASARDVPGKKGHETSMLPRQILIAHVRAEYDRALSYGAEYTVFHISDASAWEELTGTYRYTDAQVIAAAAELLNAALPENVPDGPWLLLENLWQPGLTFTDPSMTERLLKQVRYGKTGIMLDTGHLMHTNLNLHSQREAAHYIHQCLDAHGELSKAIRGIHLNQSLTGHVMRRYQKHPPVPARTYEERMNQLFTYVFSVDLHRPFVCPEVNDLIERIDPLYMTWEFISNDLEEHRRMLRRQRTALRRRES